MRDGLWEHIASIGRLTVRTRDERAAWDFSGIPPGGAPDHYDCPTHGRQDVRDQMAPVCMACVEQWSTPAEWAATLERAERWRNR